MHAPGPALWEQGEMRGRDRRRQRPPRPDRYAGAGDRRDADRREQPLYPHLRRAGKPRAGRVPPAGRNLLHQWEPAEEGAEDSVWGNHSDCMNLNLRNGTQMTRMKQMTTDK